MNEKIEIDWKYLVFAWQDSSPDAAYYFDAETGSVLLVQRDLDDIDELREEIELHPNRYLYLPKPANNRLELDLSDFVFTVSDQKLKSLLDVASEGSNKFSSCYKILSQHPEELARWEKWREDAARERARKWLAAHAIDYFD